MAFQRIEASLPAKLLTRALAVFIMLSVTGECLQCYWCGPLAEQVHRSRRAPPCAGDNNVTACEPGYTHCAIVASSPPYVESRYCIKFYQDECYTKYCSTTKTYVTTCPCRGELCNGASTQREIDAFAALNSADAKTQNNRISKRNAISSGFIDLGKRKIVNLIQNEHDDEANQIDNETKNKTKDDDDMQADQPPVSENETVNDMASNESHDSEPNHSESHDSEVSASEPMSESHDNPTTIHEEPVETTKAAESNPDMDTQNKNEMDTTPVVSETKHADSTATTEATMKPSETTKTDDNSFVSNEIKPSLQLPTAEALQQNADPVTTEKPMEPTVTVTEMTTRMTTVESRSVNMMTPIPTKSNKNNSVKLVFSSFVIVICQLISIML